MVSERKPARGQQGGNGNADDRRAVNPRADRATITKGATGAIAPSATEERGTAGQASNLPPGVEARFNFTKPGLLALPATGRFYAVHDTDEKGLVLVVSPSGAKAFYLRRKVRGRSERVHLGRFPDMGVKSARKAAVREKGAIAEGKNPNEAKRARRQDLTVGEALDAYIEQHLVPNRKPKAATTAKQLKRDYLAPLLSLKLGELTRARIAAVHARTGRNRPTRANRALEVLSAACSFVIARGQAPATWHDANPCTRIPAFKENERERYLSAGELARFLDALDHEPADLADFFRVALLTGARRSNVLAMRWADVNLTAGTWEIAASEAKAGKPLAIALPPQAVEILERQRASLAALAEDVRRPRVAERLTFREARDRNAQAKRARNGEVYVFPSWGTSGHLVEPKSAWTRILKRAKIEDLRIHDLRRTVGSWLAAQGANAFLIGKALGHASIQSTKVYARLDLAPVRAAVEKVADAFDQAVADAKKEAEKVARLTPRDAERTTKAKRLTRGAR